MKILLAVDGSDYSKRMLAFLAAHDELNINNAEMTAVAVVTPITPHAQRHLSRDIVEDYYKDVAREILDPVAAFAKQHGWKLQTESRVGAASEQIVDVAEKGGFDMIVMGSHGRSPAAGLVLGSTVSKVIARTQKPVLIIR
jgi:nucleotide-binding universal stress UspA family protein